MTTEEPDWVFVETEDDRMPAPPAVLELPYARRQSIVVVDDEVALAERAAQAEAERRAEQRPPGEASRMDWRTLLAAAPLLLIPGVGPAAAVIRVAGAAIVASDAFRRVERLRGQGVDVLTVGRSETAQLQLPAGHPRDTIVYVGDPVSPQIYYSAADFHRKTFEQKFSEVTRMLMALGATRFTVHYERGWNRAMAAHMDVPVNPVANLAGKVSGRLEQDDSLLFEASLAPNHPELPDDMYWFPHERTWQNVAIGRTKYGLKDFQLRIRYADDFGIDASFAGKVQKAQFNLGGEFVAAQETSWLIKGEFGN
jgi:hypothetical protein